MYTNDPIVKPIDAHAHLPLHQISHPICLAACRPAEWDIIEKKNVFAKGFGHHPWFVDEAWEPSRLEKILIDNPKSFVGEIGLDRSKKHKHTISKQINVCIQQLKIAQKLSRPVVFHMVRSSKISYELIRKHYGPKIYFHGYSGSIEEARRYPQAFFGFHHRMITHPKTKSLIEQIPIHQILIESDNHSQKEHLWYVIRNLAQIKNCSISDIVQITRENTLRWLHAK